MQDWQPGYRSLKICSLVQGAPCTLQFTVSIGKCNCESLYINECILQHVLRSQDFDYSMSHANTSVIPPCTNKVIHIYLYRFEDVPSYQIGSNLKLIRSKLHFQRQKPTNWFSLQSCIHCIHCMHNVGKMYSNVYNPQMHTMKIFPTELVAWWNFLWTYPIKVLVICFKFSCPL